MSRRLVCCSPCSENSSSATRWILARVSPDRCLGIPERLTYLPFSQRLTTPGSIAYLPLSKQSKGVVMKVLISGASVAGPVLAYWLHRYGFEPTIVERTPALRHGLGGHAVDLFGPAAEVTRRMGRWDAIEAARTRIESMTIERFGKRPVEIDLSRLYAGISSSHVEILRGELTKILSDGTRDTAEYLFGDSIASLH